MPVDPNIQTMLDAMAQASTGELSDMSVEEARAMIGMLALVDGEPEPVAQVSDRTIPGPAGDIPVRVYRADPGTDPLPILVWYHGGGWVIGDLTSADPTARKLANRTGRGGGVGRLPPGPRAPVPGGGRRLLGGAGVGGGPRQPSWAATRPGWPSAATAPGATCRRSWPSWPATPASSCATSC